MDIKSKAELIRAKIRSFRLRRGSQLGSKIKSDFRSGKKTSRSPLLLMKRKLNKILVYELFYLY
jgi:hypothetical protein